MRKAHIWKSMSSISMKTMRLFLAVTLLFLVVLPTESFAADPILVESITLDQESTVIPIGKTLSLKVTILPKNATVKKLEWNSSDETIATVNNGKIVGVSCGTATITASATDESKKSVKILVTIVKPIKNISLKETKLKLAPDYSWQLDYTLEPEDATIKDLAWSSTNDKVATVDEAGFVTAHKTGSCQIIASAIDGSNVKIKASVTVKNYDVVISEYSAQNISYHLDKVDALTAKASGGISGAGAISKTGCVKPFYLGMNGSGLSLTPMKAGEDEVTISLVNYTSRKKKTAKISVLVLPSAFIVPSEKASTTSTISSNTKDNQSTILFQNIPWGISYSKARDEGYLDNDIFRNSVGKAKSELIVWENKSFELYNHIVFKMGLYFSFIKDEKGNVITDEEHTSFYEAFYEFSTYNDYDIIDDLISQFTDLYGDPQTDGTIKIWEDKGVSVKLIGRNSPRLIYTWSEGKVNHDEIDAILSGR